MRLEDGDRAARHAEAKQITFLFAFSLCLLLDVIRINKLGRKHSNLY